MMIAFIIFAIGATLTAIGAYLLFVVAPRSPLDPPWGQ